MSLMVMDAMTCLLLTARHAAANQKESCDIRCKGCANLRRARGFFRRGLLGLRERSHVRARVARERRETLATVQQRIEASGGVANTFSAIVLPVQRPECDGVRATQSLAILLAVSLHQTAVK
jgi:hypothetical protein